MNKLILIPTLGRGPKLQRTWNFLSPTIRKVTSFVVSKSEVKAFTDAGLPAIVCPLQGKPTGLGPVRQWCVEYANKISAEKLALFDDDLYHWSKTDTVTQGSNGKPIRRYKSCGPKEVEEAINRMWKHLDHYAHGAIAIALFSNNNLELEYNKRAMRALFFRADILKSGRFKFDVRTRSDFDMTLKLIKAGFSNIIDSYCVQDQPASNTVGGCSMYRDLTEMNASAVELVRRYPEFVKLVTKPGDIWGYDKERVEVRVAWARMAKHYGAGALK